MSQPDEARPAFLDKLALVRTEFFSPDMTCTEGGMSGEGEFTGEREYPHSVVGIVMGGFLEKGGLRKVEPARDLLHLFGRKAARINDYRQRVSGHGSGTKYVDEANTALHAATLGGTESPGRTLGITFMRMRQVTDGIHQISKGVNAFIVDGDEGVVLIDTGLPKREGLVSSGLESIGRRPSDVRAILLTHAHIDHFGSAAALKRETGAAVYASAVDAPAIRGDERPPPPPMFPTWMAPVINTVMPSTDAVDVDHEVSDGTALPGDLTVVETPGHTPGHVSYLLDRAGGAMFVGDAAIASDGNVQKGFMNRRGSQWDASIRHLSEQKFAVACFGHSAPILADASSEFERFANTL